jgi:predicted DNA-binding transcriptional regulator AlpA
MIEMENINLIKQIADDIALLKISLSDSNTKRWLNVKEVAEYLGYSRDRIYKIKEQYLIEGIHFHNQTGKILFDRVEIDSWVVGKASNEAHSKQRQVVDNILSSLKKVS